MVSRAQPYAVARAYRLEPRMDVRWFRGVLTYSHSGLCAASALEPIRVPAHPRLCWRDPRDNGVRLGDRRAAWRCARRLSRPQAVDDARDPGLFGADRLERAVLGLAILCRVSLSVRARDRLRMGDGSIDNGRALAGQPARQ